MTCILPGTGDKEVLEDNLWFMVQQFLDWRKESDSIDVSLDAILRLE